jgi:P27 family predicted phage terminase small subunit
MPPHLTGEAKAEWERVIGQLRKLNLASSLDRAALAAYCVCWERWLGAERELRRYGAVVRSAHGYPVPSPYLTVATTALKQMREFLVEFGMSPSSRARVQTDELPGPARPPLTVLDGKSPDRFFRD